MSQTKNNRTNQESSPSKKTKGILWGAAAVIIAAVAAVVVFSNRTGTIEPPAGNETAGTDNVLASPAKEAVIKNSDLIIPIDEITQEASFFPVEIEGTKLEVLAVKAPDGTIRTAFNTCQVCFSSGRGYYKQDGDVLVCQNCGNRFHMSDVEITRGGCNPVPISGEDKIVDEESITIPKEFLTEATVIFENWKN